MIRSMFSGVSGMKGFQTKLDVIGNNIANVNTTGFKSSRVMFSDIMSQTISGVTAPDGEESGGVNAMQIGLGVEVSAVDTVHTGGSAQTTNRTLDLRIDGDGFFAVKLSTDQETPYLTRAGDFHLDAAGNLVTSDGLMVCSVDGDGIVLDEDVTSFTISQNGEVVSQLADGTTEVVAQIGVVKVVNPEGLEKMGGNLYRITLNSSLDGEYEILAPNDDELGTGAIVSGQLEMSNVDLTSEFAEMIVAQRGFQANSRIITTSDEVLQEVVNLKR